MATPYTTAFSQIRLSGQNVTTTSDSRLKVGSATTMMVSDSGAFTSAAVVQNTGQVLYSLVVGLSGASNSTFATQTTTNTLTTNLTSTGVQLGSSIGALSGWTNTTFLPRGSVETYRTGIATGSDQVWVSFPTGFAGVPRVGITVEVWSPILYLCNVYQPATSGFWSYWSDVVSETGVALHVTATY